MENTKLLVADNNQDLYKALDSVLVRFGFKVVYESSDSSAMQTLRNDSEISVAVLRYELKGLNGVELTRALRKFRPEVSVFIIADSPDDIKLPPFNGIAPVSLIGEPLHLGRLILMINKCTETIKEFSNEPTYLSGLAIPADTYFTIKDISETGCCLRSLFYLENNSIIILESKDLSQRLKLPITTSFPIRISNCRESDSGKGYDAGAQFIGLQGSTKAKLRTACLSVKGFKVTGSKL